MLQRKMLKASTHALKHCLQSAAKYYKIMLNILKHCLHVIKTSWKQNL